jgi:hypothetical protein
MGGTGRSEGKEGGTGRERRDRGQGKGKGLSPQSQLSRYLTGNKCSLGETSASGKSRFAADIFDRSA